MANNKVVRKQRRKLRVRKKIKGFAERPRLSVFRSGKHIYAQIFNDDEAITVAAASSVEKDFSDAKHGGNCAAAEKVGKLLAQRAKEKGISKVVFDRNGCIYHGRIKVLADSARAEGLEF